ncbi:hypothetical protein FRC11_007075 [Ceratobasidium sp. 423]|nr:hypothetical protein FRC11_007075 [Ceratobasidium sp. 423]
MSTYTLSYLFNPQPVSGAWEQLGTWLEPKLRQLHPSYRKGWSPKRGATALCDNPLELFQFGSYNYENSPDLCLSPPTVFGWSFVLNEWGQFAVEKLSPISFEPNALTHIVLPEEVKELIKTLTAEAIPEYLQPPLYKVSLGELYGSSEGIEMTLKRILEISSLWKAVVLIDEAEDFLNERSDESYLSSSSVGSFLRVLEYHSGIVILTTNYVRNIDKAIRSHSNLALKYKDFDQASRRILWKKVCSPNNLCLYAVKVTEIQFLSFIGTTIKSPDEPDSNYNFSRADLDKLSERNTNGREIKNVVQAAQALARSARQPLNISHIQRVWGIYNAFEAELRPEPAPILVHVPESAGNSTTSDEGKAVRQRLLGA